MKALVGAFNQEKALVGAFSVITNLRMELFGALATTLLITSPTLPPGGGLAAGRDGQVPAAGQQPRQLRGRERAECEGEGAPAGGCSVRRI